uniref:Uncharacterized protein n=1 Tax=Lactuca sativa TaxID=4236 RepID=A0A9R1XMM1_LACSA|nr:hypothetical protein LSAT_V11C200056360 [Lactuca sativa]
MYPGRGDVIRCYDPLDLCLGRWDSLPISHGQFFSCRRFRAPYLESTVQWHIGSRRCSCHFAIYPQSRFFWERSSMIKSPRNICGWWRTWINGIGSRGGVIYGVKRTLNCRVCLRSLRIIRPTIQQKRLCIYYQLFLTLIN